MGNKRRQTPLERHIERVSRPEPRCGVCCHSRGFEGTSEFVCCQLKLEVGKRLTDAAVPAKHQCCDRFRRA